MSKDTPQQPQPDVPPPSLTQIQTAPTPVAPPRTPAPSLPATGAVTGSPLTGGGPRKKKEEKKGALSARQTPGAAPPAPRRATQPPAAKVADVPAAPVAQLPGGAAASQTSSGKVVSEAPAVQTLIATLLNQTHVVDQHYYLVVLPEDDWPRTEEFDDVKDVIIRVRELLDTPCHLFPFLGSRLAITKGPNRFLRTPLGALPLFDIPAEGQMSDEDHGWMGASLDKPQAPIDVPDEYDDADNAQAEQQDVVDVPALPPPDDLGDTPMFAGDS